MTTLWVGIAAATLAAIAFLAVAALRRGQAAGDADETAIYRDQLDELSRDVERGVVAPADARAARLEIERRLLRAADRASATTTAQPSGRLAVIAAIVLLPLLTLGVYDRIGAPSLPDLPLTARAPTDDPMPQIRQMVAGLEQRLAAAPDDVEGWLMLGRSRAVLGEDAGSVAAYRRSLELAANDPRAVGGLAEALIGTARGVVTPEAQQRLRQLRSLTPDDLRADLYLGQAAAQGGDWQEALDRWRTVLERTTADTPWRPSLENEVRRVAAELKVDPAPILALSAPAAPAGAADAAPRPDADQKAFIASRIGQLEQHLAETPADVEGWQRLAQAQLVLGNPDQARAALNRGLERNPAAPSLMTGLAELLFGPPRADTGMPEVGDRARDLLARANQAAPTDPVPLWYLGARALQDGRQDEARRLWDDALAKLGQGHPDYATLKARRDSLGG